jgi:hypothetical protein
MGGLLSGLGGICGLAAFVCSIIILIAAFKDETVKGILCLCVPFYILYYGFVVFEHEKKGLIVGVWLGGGIINALLQVAAMSAS